MIKNLKFDVHKRGVVFEELARMYLRKQKENNFIFCTRSFDDMDSFADKYKFDFSGMSLSVMAFLNKKMKSVDLIEFIVSDNESRLVSDMVFYEVKSRIRVSNYKFDVCRSSHDAYSYLLEKGFSCNLVSFVLLEDWSFSFQVSDLDLSKYRLYSRYKT